MIRATFKHVFDIVGIDEIQLDSSHCRLVASGNSFNGDSRIGSNRKLLRVDFRGYCPLRIYRLTCVLFTIARPQVAKKRQAQYLPRH